MSIHKRWHDGEVTLAERDLLLGDITSQVLDPCLLLRIEPDVLAEVPAVASRFPLRTLDAVHVATAVLADRRLRGGPGAELRFCTADRRQAVAASGLLGSSRVDLLPPWR